VITAVDTNVLLDVLTADATFGQRSAECLRRCVREGALVACDIVWAETAAHFADEQTFCNTMDRLGVAYSPLPEEAARAAGRTWQTYRRRGGPRKRLVADFFVAAHACAAADRLLTRDRGFYASNFHDLLILDPSQP